MPKTKKLTKNGVLTGSGERVMILMLAEIHAVGEEAGVDLLPYVSEIILAAAQFIEIQAVAHAQAVVDEDAILDGVAAMARHQVKRLVHRQNLADMAVN